MERRQSTRIPFRALASIYENGRAVSSEICDISNRGLFIRTTGKHTKAEKTFVTIRLNNETFNLAMTLPCLVARVSDSGIGCTSSHLNPETLLFMTNLLNARNTDSREFMQSFYSYLGELEFHRPSR